MFNTVLIANRGEIAVRAIRTLKKMGITSVAVYSDTDRYAQHVIDADLAISLHGIKPIETYLSIEKIIDAALKTGAQAIFPGYGFLSESAEFSRQCAQNNIVFIGPTAEQITEFGLKHRARELAALAKVPMTPGTGLLPNLDDALHAAESIGYPVMLKSTAGGGGIGLTRCDNRAALIEAYDRVKRLGEQFFKDAGVFIERFIDKARHVEVQILGDQHSRVIALGERDCSLQRRNQKIVEETPAPQLPETTRRKLHQAAVQLGQIVGYRSVGTVEFIYDAASDEFYFLEVNTRLQVEHAVTEMVTGIDLIECMLKVAANEALDWEYLTNIQLQGVAIEVRIYAEDPIKNFQPSPGVLTEVSFPKDIRVDTWVTTGTEVTQYFDPMLAKIIVHAENRERAIEKLETALAETRLEGISTNLDYAAKIITAPHFKNMQIWTRFLDDFKYMPRVIEVIQPGTLTTIQDYPGRIGYWHIGVPPSGPMDDLAFQLANKIVANPIQAAGFEFTLIGPTLKFHADTCIALTGAPCLALLDGKAIEFWQPISVKSGQTLQLGQVQSGCRTYMAIQHGLNVPLYLGSRSTFVLGHFGGHAGRILRAGDTIKLTNPITTAPHTDASTHNTPQALSAALIPTYSNKWEIGVLYGPHGAPDFFKAEYIEEFFAAEWTVHFNSNRLGIRLTGPVPRWARENGGEAGLHPSNIHDCEYAIGAINFTGDFPVILAKDGPSLGGFVCPVTIAKAELWKIGQLKADDTISFYPLSIEQANQLEQEQLNLIENFATARPEPIPHSPQNLETAILAEKPATTHEPKTVYRQAGDSYILLEYGDDVLDLSLRIRVHKLIELIRSHDIHGILELSPGVRSLQIKYDTLVISQKNLITQLLQLEQKLGDLGQIKIPSRIIHLPMAFEDSSTLNAVQRYQESVCAKAPWLPNNVDFIQKINGLKHRDEVKDILFNANYLVLGLGDVYLTAPCAIPLDPRHRLLSSKYNPARTFTAEGTVGIGGMYMCIYGMDSPGGYQLVGRTLPIWNKFKKNRQFGNKQWFLNFFDQIKFFEVSESELEQLRLDFAHGQAEIKIEESEFDYAQYCQFLEDEAQSILAFKQKQQLAFETEVKHYQEEQVSEYEKVARTIEQPTLNHRVSLNASMTGNIWKILVEQNQVVKKGQTIAIIEAMKMELPVQASEDGIVKAIICHAGQTVHSGQPLVYLK
ncbi:urea carboxylase [Acinetobacter rudis]|uniref:Biotin carboxylase n=1 Tax=Acinetobacter rudis TaxID=632955 RepID=A0AAW8JA31_9GAMM|nr:urea carboxylase [Acinetobacter rudis]MDQ8936433.1 urea carboxylase [Acinetobacter rudis]MDQ9018703.1 urea carboxylase [Acinetobacter rudis]